jgi:hypothetical protein
MFVGGMPKRNARWGALHTCCSADGWHGVGVICIKYMAMGMPGAGAACNILLNAGVIYDSHLRPRPAGHFSAAVFSVYFKFGLLKNCNRPHIQKGIINL